MFYSQSYQHWARPPYRRQALGPVGRGHCMALRGDGQWDGYRCPNRFPYLCERSEYGKCVKMEQFPKGTVKIFQKGHKNSHPGQTLKSNHGDTD